ncbi:hypothetical protein [Salinimonas lutimaris]|uniref:hypothetical protein n=1 Tax=Salinimonas lutimaris TaxID=914153 RepID=UPI0010BFA320|nr:hypothetical protein [Salinimonas lutimaris]
MYVAITSSVKGPKPIATVSTPHKNAIALTDGMPYIPISTYSEHKTGAFLAPISEIEFSARTKKFILVLEECQYIKGASISDGQSTLGHFSTDKKGKHIYSVCINEASPGATYKIMVERGSCNNDVIQAFANFSVVHISEEDR